MTFTLDMSDIPLDSSFTTLPHVHSVIILKLHVQSFRGWRTSFRGEDRLYNILQVTLPKIVEFAIHRGVNVEFLSKFKLEELRSLSLQLGAGVVAEPDSLLAAVKRPLLQRSRGLTSLSSSPGKAVTNRWIL